MINLQKQSFVSKLVSLFGFPFETSVQKYLRQRAAFNATYRELDRLSERELWDLGLCRADIARVSREAAAKV